MKRTEICILGVIHSLHKQNKNYTYDDVFKTIENFEPDVIGIEIRPEDINKEQNYLIKYYPYEMIEAKLRFEDKCKIYGFDWFSQDSEGKLLWDGFFNNKIKLEKNFETDIVYERERRVLEANDNVRLEMILNSNVSEINNGNYDVVSNLYYKQLKILLKGTPYEKLSELYENRDTHIDKNIINIIKENSGKRILLLMGVDHRSFAISSIKENISENITFVSL